MERYLFVRGYQSTPGQVLLISDDNIKKNFIDLCATWFGTGFCNLSSACSPLDVFKNHPWKKKKLRSLYVPEKLC